MRPFSFMNKNGKLKFYEVTKNGIIHFSHLHSQKLHSAPDLHLTDIPLHFVFLRQSYIKRIEYVII